MSKVFFELKNFVCHWYFKFLLINGTLLFIWLLEIPIGIGYLLKGDPTWWIYPFEFVLLFYCNYMFYANGLLDRIFSRSYKMWYFRQYGKYPSL